MFITLKFKIKINVAKVYFLDLMNREFLNKKFNKFND